jgi:glycolate oxidase FAD binding subunit
MQSIEAIQSAIQRHPRIFVRAGGSKPTLTQAIEGATALDLCDLTAILEYQPGEYTITAQAGAPLTVVQAALAENGQYLPFDPPLAQHGATLGGTIAAGLSGSGRYRYGGVRDFLIGIRFVDGQGRLVRGGGKVVKNAAGFDLPKLMVGSLGRLGVLAEVSFKVFPRPQSYATLQVTYPQIEAALAALHQVAAARLDIDALDVLVEAQDYTLCIRLGGWEAILGQRLTQLRTLLGGGNEISGVAEAASWATASEFTWAPADWALVKVATTPAQISMLEQQLLTTPALRRYAVGGHLTWLAWPGALTDLQTLLAGLQLGGLVIRGATANPRIGVQPGQAFARRIKQALDPMGKFLEPV